MSRLILLDNTVLSNFAQARVVSTIFSLWRSQICTTTESMTEYTAGVTAAGLPKSAWSDLKIFELSQDEQDFGSSLSARLGMGECSCLAIAYKRGAIFATDDLFARVTAKRFNIPVIGTIGILVQCVTKEILTHAQAQHALDLMISNGYHSPITDIRDLC